MLGTFWPFVTAATRGDARLRSAKAGMAEVAVTRPAVTVLEVARAIVGVEVAERELGREENVELYDDRYAKFRLGGTVMLHNGKTEPVEVEVTRRVDEVRDGGESQQLDLLRA